MYCLRKLLSIPEKRAVLKDSRNSGIALHQILAFPSKAALGLHETTDFSAFSLCWFLFQALRSRGGGGGL